MLNKKYFNSNGILLLVCSISIIILMIIENNATYEEFVKSPLENESRTTSSIVTQAILYFTDQYLGWWGTLSIFLGLSILGFVSGFNWYEIFYRNK